MTGEAYNPLDKLNLARSIEIELLGRAPIQMADAGQLTGAGVYAIYYTGDFPAYAPLKAANTGGQFNKPIYVGKAIPKGGRKGGLTADARLGKALGERLRQHAASIDQAQNLSLADFHVRHLVVDDIWIPLGENMLIESFQPLWNRVVDGFGNKTPGKRRKDQFRSAWDVIHPGRTFAQMLAENPLTDAVILERVTAYFQTGQTPPDVADGDPDTDDDEDDAPPTS